MPLIVFEGIDGSGKTTQSKLLKKHFGKKAFLTKEPWKKGFRTSIIKLISKKTKTDDQLLDFLLFAADRRMHVLTEIKPALNKKQIVILDRYYYSSYAYQPSLKFSLVKQLDLPNPKPKICFVLDVSPKTAMYRLKKTGKVLSKYENFNTLKKARANYKKIAKKFPEVKIIDASKSIKQVHEEILRHLKKLKL